MAHILKVSVHDCLCPLLRASGQREHHGNRRSWEESCYPLAVSEYGRGEGVGREREEKTEKEGEASDEEPGKAGYQSLNNPGSMNVSVA